MVKQLNVEIEQIKGLMEEPGSIIVVDNINLYKCILNNNTEGMTSHYVQKVVKYLFSQEKPREQVISRFVSNMLESHSKNLKSMCEDIQNYQHLPYSINYKFSKERSNNF